MDLRSRVDQVLKGNECAVVWDEDGFRLIAPAFETEDATVPEDIVALMFFIERYTKDDDFAEELLNWSEERDEESE